MTNSIDTWETSTYTYYNSTAEDVTLVIRFQGMNASGNMFSGLKVTQINVDLTAALANIAVVDGIVDAILVDTGTDIPATIATVDGVADAIKLKTDNLPSDPADESLLEAAIATRAAPGDGMDMVNAPNATALAAIADALHDETFEGTITLRELERLILAVMAGKANGGGTTTISFRDQADGKDRLTLTVDTSSGDRSATALDLD